MISCLKLEQPGGWRLAGLGAIFLLALAPGAILLGAGGGGPDADWGAQLRGPFGTALGRSLAVALGSTALSLAVGLPAGLLAGLYDFPARRLLLAVLALPLLVPTFIQSIGLSLASGTLGTAWGQVLAGLGGTVLVFSFFGVPLVLFGTLAAIRGVARSQADAVRLAGGEWHLVARVAREVLPAASLTAALAGVLTLSDPGPGQILGHAGAAAEILVSFAARYDFGLAARQCLLLAGVVLVIALPVALRLAPRLATALLARDATPVARVRLTFPVIAGPITLGTIAAVTLVLPLAGFARPLQGGFPLGRVGEEIARTGGPTMLFAGTAAVLATVLGTTAALCAGRSPRLRIVLLVGLVVVLSLPPSLPALGLMQLATAGNATLDPILRSWLTVGLAQATRLFPIVALFALRSLGTSSPSWTSAAALHGLSLPTFVGRILGPWLAPAVVSAAMLVGLLATAEVGSVLLLHPPGMSSLPLAIFTIMANAPEALVGGLCLAYVGAAALLLGLGRTLLATYPRNS